jgi:hypothetical protein
MAQVWNAALSQLTIDLTNLVPGENSVLLANALASVASAFEGPGIVGFSGSLNYAARTLGGRLNDQGCSPRSLGAVGDGVADDTAAIQQCLTYSRTLDLRNRSWKISSTINLPAGTVVDMRGAYIQANTGASPLFTFTGAAEGLTMLGGIIQGTCSAFFQCTGTTNTPTSTAHYARQIRLEGIYITSPTIGLFLDFQQAVRQVFIDKCFAYTQSGISASGKCVEVKIHKCIIYSSTGVAGTYSVKLRSPGGTSYYHEGWHFTDCTIDNAEVGFDVTDVFVLTVNGGYLGRASSGTYAALFGQPTSNFCADIKFNGAAITGQIKFAPTSGRDYAATFNGCTSMNIPGGSAIALEIGNNASGVTVRNHKFRNATAGGNNSAIRMTNNNYRCVVSGVDIDGTFEGGGVHVLGANGTDCEVHNVSHAGGGEPIIVQRPVRMSGVPIATSYGGTVKQSFNTGSIAGSYTVGSAIASLALNFPKGETGWIVVELSLTGMNGAASAQRLDIAVPAGVVIPSGTGWGSQYLYPEEATGKISVRIPYYCTANVTAGTLSITNAAGNAVAVTAHSYFGIVRNM